MNEWLYKHSIYDYWHAWWYMFDK